MKTIAIATTVLCLILCAGCSDSDDDNGGTNPPAPPETPTGLAVTATGLMNLTLSWDAVDDADEYRLYRAESAAGTYTLVYSGAALEYADIGLDYATPYYYQVGAANDGGEGDRSAAVTGTTDTPTGFEVAGSPGGGVDATYNYHDDFNDKPRYQSVPIGLSIFFPGSGDFAGHWCIWDMIEGMVLYYHPTATGDYPPPTGWLHHLDDSATSIVLTPFVI
jgi:hypothetical protein